MIVKPQVRDGTPPCTHVAPDIQDYGIKMKILKSKFTCDMPKSQFLTIPHM